MPDDVITILTQDHRQVDTLLDQLITGQTTGDARAEAISTVIRELSVHAAAEEMVLYPEMRSSLPNGDQQVEDALSEHQRIKDALDELDGKSPDDPGVMDTISSVAAEVRHHVEEEEGDLFTQLRSHVSDADRVTLGQNVERAKKAAPTHPHPDAPNTPPGNVIMGVPTALVDRMRDAISG